MRIAPIGLLLVAASAAGCAGEAVVKPRAVVRLIDSGLSQSLIREYAGLPDIDVRLVGAGGSVAAVDALHRGNADLGFVFADVAYFAHQQHEDHPVAGHGQLRGIAALQVAPVHLLVRPGLSIHRVEDLRGLTVGTGEPSSRQTVLAELLFAAYGVGPEKANYVALTAEAIPDALAAGTVDVAFTTTGYYPGEIPIAAMRRGAHLIPIEGPIAERLTREYPFVQSVMVPSQTYPGQDIPLRTIGIQRVFVCRSDLDDRVVYELTKHFLQALPRLGPSVQTSLRLMDLDRAAATPIPLHKGAAQYYRERELSR